MALLENIRIKEKVKWDGPHPSGNFVLGVGHGLGECWLSKIKYTIYVRDF